MPWDRTADWFAEHARDLPWRREPRDPWETLVSEVMLQQTQVRRVVPAFLAWLAAWPDAAALAAAPVPDVLRAWAGLGYPRRALRLHQTASTVTQHYDGLVPSTRAELVALPGVGEYTAAAVLAFAHRHRIAVLDTNVRRVLHRHSAARALPAPAAPTRREHDQVTDSLPSDPDRAARASEAVMELGALVCTSASPDCSRCPIAEDCAWLAAGRPGAGLPARRQPRFEGSDRQARGRIMLLLRKSPGPVQQATIDAIHLDPEQGRRAQHSLSRDGLIVVAEDLVALPR